MCRQIKSGKTNGPNGFKLKLEYFLIENILKTHSFSDRGIFFIEKYAIKQYM